MKIESKREIRKRIISIFLTSIYFISMTILSIHLNESYSLAGIYNALSIRDKSEGLTYMNALPLSDQEGLKQDSYVFEITNTANKRIKYIVEFENVGDSSYESLDYKYIRYSISKDNKNFSNPTNMSQDGYLMTDVISGNTKQTYYLKFWIDSNAGNEILNKSLNFKIKITQFDIADENS